MSGEDGMKPAKGFTYHRFALFIVLAMLLPAQAFASGNQEKPEEGPFMKSTEAKPTGSVGGSNGEARDEEKNRGIAPFPETLVQNLEAYSTAIFAGGCFWCLEKPYEQLVGVAEVISGYTGGTTPDPRYPEVSSGQTDHREAVA